MEYVYVILSRSNTMFARAIRRFTKKYYNHTSIAFEESLTPFYSFGRLYPRVMFPAGFITEGVHKGFFKVHPDTKICAIKVPLTQEQLVGVKAKLKPFTDNPRYYQYNVLRMPLMMAGIPTKNDRKYVCSVFVAKLLGDVLDFGKDYSLVYPEDFLSFGFEIIYEGTAGDYEK
ncbi:MAG: hypothetical protein RSE24_03260 [Oscillospiraceae bacterium]